MIVINILKLIVGVAGFGYMLSKFLPGINDPQKRELKKPLFAFLITAILLIVVTAIEYFVRKG